MVSDSAIDFRLDALSTIFPCILKIRIPQVASAPRGCAYEVGPFFRRVPISLDPGLSRRSFPLAVLCAAR